MNYKFLDALEVSPVIAAFTLETISGIVQMSPYKINTT